ncbi:E3 ubiquitin-protein ligase listerin-like [Trichoplusia ni]|uniref:E3 ubiquitin-protein ligase listerin n=1 Tax=Trichoplusia ni TaxID=7111 RepID=A0A7E5WD43_TRINI|nr:E3 ubiquitin-protein ligase listerin-like [Trichoplusia ni]
MSWQTVEWCLAVSARHPAVTRAAARRWLAGAGAGEALVRLAERAAAARAPPAAPLLLACVAGARPLAGAAALARVLAAVGAALAPPRGAALDPAAALAARLVSDLHDHAHSDHYERLVRDLFRLNILVPRGDPRLSVDTWCEVRSSWQDGLAAMPRDARQRALQQAASFIHDQLFLDIKDLDISKIENVVSPCAELVWVGAGAEGAADASRLLLSRGGGAGGGAAGGARGPEAAALRLLCLSARLCCPQRGEHALLDAVVGSASDPDAEDLTEAELVPYVHDLLFRAVYLRTLFLHKIGSDDDEDEESNSKTWCDTLLQDEYLRDEFCRVLYDYIVIYLLEEGYQFWSRYDLIRQAKQKMDSLLEDVISASGPSGRDSVARALDSRALAAGYLWPLARRWYPSATPAPPAADAPGLLHTLQAGGAGGADAAAQYRARYVVMLHSWHAAHAASLEPAELRRALADAARCDPDLVINAYYRHNHTMLYDRDISDLPWNDVLSNVSVVEFLTAMVETCGWEAPAHHWDFTTITMCSLLSSLEKSKHKWSCSKVAMLARAALRLFAAVRGFVRDVRARALRQQPAPHVADLMAEWTDIFAPDTHHNLFTIILHVLESCTTMELTSSKNCVLEALCSTVELMEWEALGKARATGPLALAALARRLAARLLRRLAAPLVLDDAERLSLWSDDSSADDDAEHERPEFSLDYFHDTFTQLHEIVEAALSTVVLGEATCELVTTSDSYSMALGWLLLAEIIASVCHLARGDLYHHYLQIYRERKYVEAVLETALRLLPAELFAFAASTAPAAPPPHYASLFDAAPDFCAPERAAEEATEVAALACRGVFSALCGPGAGGARGWWGAAPGRAARLLERLVRAYVAPPAARQQLRALQQRAAELADVEVRIAWSSNEVTCLYTVEERVIELRVWLSPAHPLTPPRIAAADELGPGANTHWVALYLAYQNGTILNALKMWTQAVSAKVESSPQCYICYCRLHPNTGRLPRVPCHQCKNKFHNLCLRKWFATSNKSNCPLCRSTF